MQDGTLEISNVRGAGVRSIRVNNVVIDVPHNTLERELKTEQTPKKTRQRANVQGIPRDIFEYLVTEHRPIHIQFIRLVFYFALIITLVALTMLIISKFKMVTPSESSDVMHVIFIVTVGALPRVLELALLDGNEMFKRQLEETKIEQSTLRYWGNRLESFEDSSRCSHNS
ncbi:hypothetical protein DPMN_173311 [Dreissena polymorpha]|uniref:Uncharacterized protein n=1 Tax=Dreissena polymorpha TaxID=45954 RepID=A0A9D4IFD9_DREPO|nr:hypothetical protein DPMN_173311 [Dreissena polymorpha]